MINLKDKIILAVKTVIANEASVETEDGITIGLYLESNDVDHIAEQVADDLSAEENRIRRDTVKEFAEKLRDKEFSVKIGSEWVAVVKSRDIDELVKEV